MIVKRRKLNGTVFDDIPYDCWGVIIKFCKTKEFLKLMRVQKKLLGWIKKNPWLIKDMVFTLSKKFDKVNCEFPFKFVGWIFENVRNIKFTVPRHRLLDGLLLINTQLSVPVYECTYIKRIFGERKKGVDVKIGMVCPLNSRHIIPLNSDHINVFPVIGKTMQYGCQKCHESLVNCKMCDEEALCDDRGLCGWCDDHSKCIECKRWFFGGCDTTEWECEDCTQCQCEYCCDTQMRKRFYELKCINCGNVFEICESCRMDGILCVPLCKLCSLVRISNNIAQKKKFTV